jgi:hypothetical protein
MKAMYMQTNVYGVQANMNIPCYEGKSKQKLKKKQKVGNPNKNCFLFGLFGPKIVKSWKSKQ